MKNIMSILLALLMTTLLISGCSSGVSNSNTIGAESNSTSWKNDLPIDLVKDINYAFSEIGENTDNIQSIEYIDSRETELFSMKDYKVTFSMKYEHYRWYRITTREWNTGEPERSEYPREYLATIKFWSDDNDTNINQWTQTGNGKLQDPSAGEYVITVSSNNLSSDEVESSNTPLFEITAEELANEINSNIEQAKEKYNGKLIQISGTVTFISDGGGMYGYYLYGARGEDGLKITCWVESNSNNLHVGDSVTFIGTLREVTTFNNTEIGNCSIVE